MCTSSYTKADGYQTKDCGKCNCGSSSATHSPATDPDNGMRYCTKCDEYI
jgi:hypothetical protein